MKNFKDFITEKMRKDPRQEEMRLLARLERIRSEIPSMSREEEKLAIATDPSIKNTKEGKIASGKLFKQFIKGNQYRDVDAALQGVEDINRGAVGKQTSALSRGFGSKSNLRAYRTSIKKYAK